MDFWISAEKCSFRGNLKKAFLHFWQIFVIWSFVFRALFSKHILGTQSITIIHALFQNTKYGYEHHHATNRSSSKTSENKLKTQKTSVVHAHCAGKTTSWLIKSQFWKSLPFDFTLHTDLENIKIGQKLIFEGESFSKLALQFFFSFKSLI